MTQKNEPKWIDCDKFDLRLKDGTSYIITCSEEELDRLVELLTKAGEEPWTVEAVV